MASARDNGDGTERIGLSIKISRLLFVSARFWTRVSFFDEGTMSQERRKLDAQRRAQTPSAMSSSATLGVETRARKRKQERRDATAADAGEAIPGLLNDIFVTHVLRTEHFDDPADLARLPAVSRAMRDLVAETGLRFEELDEKRAVELGCVSAVQRMQRQGRLSRQERLCQAAARSGQLEELKALRENDTPWDTDTCWRAAAGGHLEVMQWARENGCPWNAETCTSAAQGGHLEVLQWARANDCPWNEGMFLVAATGGQLEVLQWLRTNGCPWNADTCSVAATGGHLEVLQWLRANGCPWNWVTCINVATVAIKQWAIANGCPELEEEEEEEWYTFLHTIRRRLNKTSLYIQRPFPLVKKHGRHDQRDRGEHLDKHVNRRPRGVFKRVPHGVPRNGGFVRVRVFTPVRAAVVKRKGSVPSLEYGCTVLGDLYSM